MWAAELPLVAASGAEAAVGGHDRAVQDRASVVDYLIQTIPPGARSPAKEVKRSGNGPASSKKQERSLAD